MMINLLKLTFIIFFIGIFLIGATLVTSKDELVFRHLFIASFKKDCAVRKISRDVDGDIDKGIRNKLPEVILDNYNYQIEISSFELYSIYRRTFMDYTYPTSCTINCKVHVEGGGLGNEYYFSSHYGNYPERLRWRPTDEDEIYFNDYDFSKILDCSISQLVDSIILNTSVLEHVLKSNQNYIDIYHSDKITIDIIQPDKYIAYYAKLSPAMFENIFEMAFPALYFIDELKQEKMMKKAYMKIDIQLISEGIINKISQFNQNIDTIIIKFKEVGISGKAVKSSRFSVYIPQEDYDSGIFYIDYSIGITENEITTEYNGRFSSGKWIMYPGSLKFDEMKKCMEYEMNAFKDRIIAVIYYHILKNQKSNQ